MDAPHVCRFEAGCCHHVAVDGLPAIVLWQDQYAVDSAEHPAAREWGAPVVATREDLYALVDRALATGCELRVYGTDPSLSRGTDPRCGFCGAAVAVPGGLAVGQSVEIKCSRCSKGLLLRNTPDAPPAP